MQSFKSYLLEKEQLDEIQTGWYHKTQKYHTIKHPDGSHWGVYDHSTYGTKGYEIRKIRDEKGNTLRAKESRNDSGDRYMAGYTGGPTNAAKEWIKKYGGKITNHKIKESVDLDESKSATGYTLYHKTYTDAINHALAHHESNGHTISDDTRDRHIAMGPRKPSEGKTVSLNLPTEQKNRRIHIQIYNKGGSKPYELNTYSS